MLRGVADRAMASMLETTTAFDEKKLDSEQGLEDSSASGSVQGAPEQPKVEVGLGDSSAHGSTASLSTCSPGEDSNDMPDSMQVDMSKLQCLPCDTDATPEGKQTVEMYSIGSRGHPDNCNFPCKYFRKKAGCRDGAKCTRCHICEWRNGSSHSVKTSAVSDETPTKVPQESAWPPGFHLLAAANGIPSVGSIGHPFKCALACKYATKANGCKDGHACVRCHMCRWSKSLEKSANQHVPMNGRMHQAAGQAPMEGLLGQMCGMGLDVPPMYIPLGNATPWKEPWVGQYGAPPFYNEQSADFYYNGWSC